MNTSNRSHQPRKRFGQHFLADQQVLHRIASALKPHAEQNIVEIGPGLGALTRVLLDHISHLTVIELDRDLAAKLVASYDQNTLTVIEMDILDCDLNTIRRDTPDQKLRLIGNLPYNISTPLIFHLLNQIEQVEDMLFMLQREVALRLAAAPGSKNYGRLSVMAALDLKCECLFDVPPSAFDPPPKVDSTIIRLQPKSDRRTDFDRIRLNQVVAAAFSQRRKTLRNALGKVITTEQFLAADIDSSLRAEVIAPKQFIRLAQV